MYATLEIEKRNSVGTIWMNRPDVHNAFNPPLIEEITAACNEIDADPALRVMVLAGRGRSFSAGADLNSMKAAGEASIDVNLDDARKLAGMLRTLAEMKKPTIARVHGAAIGGGMGLASACHICVASENAYFATSEVRFGIIPAVISPYVIRAIGERQSFRFFQTAEHIDAPLALRLGLAHEVTTEVALDEKISEIVSALLRGAPQAQDAARDLIRAVASRPIDDTLVEDTAQRIAQLRAMPEAREGLAAFLGKRPAEWVPPT